MTYTPYEYPQTSVPALQLAWLKERRAALLAGEVISGQERSVLFALRIIEDAIRRHEP